MNKYHWERVEKELHVLDNPVKLDCDGYILTLALIRIDQFHNEIAIRVNDEIKVEWALSECPERRRFFSEHRKFIRNRKERARAKSLIKKMGKGLAQKYGLNADSQVTYYMPFWTSFRELKKHLLKNNRDIRLLSVGEGHMDYSSAIIAIPETATSVREEVTNEAQVCAN